MRKIVTEQDLRAGLLPEGTREYTVGADVFVTEAARDYLERRGIELRVREGAPAPVGRSMSRTPVPDRGNSTYIDARTGRGYREKPEEMTHLRGNLLVPKTHPRITLRGKLDSLEAKILECQAMACAQGESALCAHLGEVLEHVRSVLGAEVKESPLPERPLFGLGHAQLRGVSHNVKAELGIDHPIPDYTMGPLPLAVNTLRTQARECELAAAAAFEAPGEAPRPDIIQELNRLSSGIYILFCRLLAGYYKGGGA